MQKVVVVLFRFFLQRFQLVKPKGAAAEPSPVILQTRVDATVHALRKFKRLRLPCMSVVMPSSFFPDSVLKITYTPPIRHVFYNFQAVLFCFFIHNQYPNDLSVRASTASRSPISSSFFESTSENKRISSSISGLSLHTATVMASPCMPTLSITGFSGS